MESLAIKFKKVFFLLIVVGCMSVASVVNAQSYGTLERVPFEFLYNNASTNKIVSAPLECIGSPTSGIYSSNKNMFKWSTSTLDWVQVEGSSGGACISDAGKMWHSFNSSEIHGQDGFYILAANASILSDGLYVKVVGGTGAVSSNYNDYDYAFPFQIQNGTTTPITNPVYTDSVATSSYQTRITNVSFVNSTTSQIQLTATYFLNIDEIISSISEKNPTLISYQLTNSTDDEIFGQSENINNTIQGTASSTTTFSGLTDGDYDVLVRFSNVGCLTGFSSCPFPLSYIYTSFTLTSGVLTATGSIEIYNNLVVPTTPKLESSVAVKIKQTYGFASVSIPLAHSPSVTSTTIVKGEDGVVPTGVLSY